MQGVRPHHPRDNFVFRVQSSALIAVLAIFLAISSLAIGNNGAGDSPVPPLTAPAPAPAEPAAPAAAAQPAAAPAGVGQSQGGQAGGGGQAVNYPPPGYYVQTAPYQNAYQAETGLGQAMSTLKPNPQDQWRQAVYNDALAQRMAARERLAQAFQNGEINPADRSVVDQKLFEANALGQQLGNAFPIAPPGNSSDPGSTVDGGGSGSSYPQLLSGGAAGLMSASPSSNPGTDNMTSGSTVPGVLQNNPSVAALPQNEILNLGTVGSLPGGASSIFTPSALVWNKGANNSAAPSMPLLASALGGPSGVQAPNGVMNLANPAGIANAVAKNQKGLNQNDLAAAALLKKTIEDAKKRSQRGNNSKATSSKQSAAATSLADNNGLASSSKDEAKALAKKVRSLKNAHSARALASAEVPFDTLEADSTSQRPSHLHLFGHDFALASDLKGRSSTFLGGLLGGAGLLFWRRKRFG